MTEPLRKGFKRTRQLNVRCTPVVCEALKALAEQDGCSEADVLENLVLWAYAHAWADEVPEDKPKLSVVA